MLGFVRVVVEMLAVTFSVYLLTASVVHVNSFILGRRVLGSSGCKISLNKDIPFLSPLVINDSQRQLIYPSEDDVIVLEPNAQFVLYCQSAFSNRKIQDTGIQVSCKQGDSVTYNGDTYRFSQLGCTKYSDSTIKRVNGLCAGNHSLIEIGYEYKRPGALNLDGEGFDEGSDEGFVEGEHPVEEGYDEDVDGESDELEELRETIVIEQKREDIAEWGKDETRNTGTEDILSSLNLDTNQRVPKSFEAGPEKSDQDIVNIRDDNGGENGRATVENSDQKSGLSAINPDLENKSVTINVPENGNNEATHTASEIKSSTFKKPSKKRPQGSVEWIKLIDVCYDFKHHKTIYSLHSLDERIKGRQRNVKRPYFKPDIFTEENIDVNKLYYRTEQIKRLTDVLGSEDLAKKYIQKDDHFLSRGHYSPKADFIFGTEQTATFYYINVAPQWQTFNGGNWVHLENAVRDLIVKEQGKVQVYTGTHGVITLNDVDDKPVEIYLGEKDGRQIIPVPKYYWKVIYNPEKKEGVAVVGINNPYLEVSEDDILCEDICHIYNWIDWDLKNQEKGHMFCCVLAEFQKKFINIGLESA